MNLSIEFRFWTNSQVVGNMYRFDLANNANAAAGLFGSTSWTTKNTTVRACTFHTGLTRYHASLVLLPILQQW